jgi:hypothetical protein
MGWWRSKKSGEKRTDQHRDDSGDRDAMGGGQETMKTIAEGFGRGVADAVLDRIVITPGMVETVKRWFK